MPDISCFLCMTLDECLVGEQMLIYHYMLFWVICMLVSSCILEVILHKTDWMTSHHFWSRSRVLPWRFKGKTIWWIVMYVNIFRVFLGVVIGWNKCIVVNKTKKVCLMWYIIVFCQVSWFLSCDQLWYHQVSIQLLLQFPIWMLQYWFQVCCWHSYYRGVLQRMR